MTTLVELQRISELLVNRCRETYNRNACAHVEGYGCERCLLYTRHVQLKIKCDVILDKRDKNKCRNKGGCSHDGT